MTWYNFRTSVVWTADGGYIRPAAGATGRVYDVVTGVLLSDLRQNGTGVSVLNSSADASVEFEVNGKSVVDVDFGSGRRRLISTEAQAAAETAAADAASSADAVLGLSDSLPTSPMKYGAVGNGVADDSAAFQAAINAAPSGGEVIVPPNYIFKLGSTVTINKPLKLSGCGQILMGTGYAAIKVTSSDVTVDGLRIQGGGTGGTQVMDTKAIWALGTSAIPLRRVRIQNCVVKGIASDGIWAEWCIDSTIHRNNVTDLLYSAIMLISVTDSQVTNNQVGNLVQKAPVVNTYGIAATDWDNTIAARSKRVLIAHNEVNGVPGWEGIDTHGGDQISVIGNKINGCLIPIAFVVGNASRVISPINGIIAHNQIDADGAAGAYAAIRLVGLSGQLASATVQGNRIYGYATPYETTFIDEDQCLFMGNLPERTSFPAWTTLPLNAPYWSAVAGFTPEFLITRRDGIRRLNIRGYVVRAATGSQVVATLPVGSRPSFGQIIGPVGVSSVSGGIQTTYSIVVKSDGTVSLSYEADLTKLVGHTIYVADMPMD